MRNWMSVQPLQLRLTVLERIPIMAALKSGRWTGNVN